MVRISDPIGYDKFTETERRAAEFLKTSGPLNADGTAFASAAGAFEILLHAPMQSLGLWQLGRAPWAKLEDSHERAWGAYEHEWVDQVLAIDCGNLALTDIHLPLAISAGIRVEAIEALRDDRLEDLTEEEANFVSFVRQARDGHIADDLYAWMKGRLGSDHAVIDYIMLVLILVVHTTLTTIFDYPSPSQDDFNEQLSELAQGKHLLDVEKYEAAHLPRFKQLTNWLYTLDDAAGFDRDSAPFNQPKE